jgi:hypothetical protein
MLGLVMESPGGSRTWRVVPRPLTAEEDGGGRDAEAAPCLLGTVVARPDVDGVPGMRGAAPDGWRHRWPCRAGWVVASMGTRAWDGWAA